MFLIYRHTNLKTGKSYIGYTHQSIKDRWDGHVQSALRGATWVFHCSIRKHGASCWKHDVIQDHLGEDDVCAAERYWIKKLKTKVPDGYNMTDGGDGAPGYVFTDDDLTKMRERATERERRWKETGTKPKQGRRPTGCFGFHGHRHSVETKARLRAIGVEQARARGDYDIDVVVMGLKEGGLTKRAISERLGIKFERIRTIIRRNR